MIIFVKLPQWNRLLLRKFTPIAKKAPVKLWQVPTEPHARAEAPYTHKACACKATPATTYIIQPFFILYNSLYYEQIVIFSFANQDTLSYANNKRPSVARSNYTIISPCWGVFIRKQMLFYSLFCAIIINDNRVAGWRCLHSLWMEVMSMELFSFQDLMSFGMFMIALLTFIILNTKK